MKYFGTDGMRGRANLWPVTPDVMMRLGMAAGANVTASGTASFGRHRVLIGKDTRRSGYMLQFALTSGFVAAGLDVISVGPLPTPAIAMLTKSMRASLGVMITASHNPCMDNGVKMFDAGGYKLDDARETDIENRMDADLSEAAVGADQLGQVTVYDGAVGRYIEAIKHTLPSDLSLSGLKVVIDCAHGAAYRAGPEALWELGAETIAIGVAPDGLNINHECGSIHPDLLVAKVRAHEADLGIALDGDGDRVILVDNLGRIINGDQILARMAIDMVAGNTLKGGGVVSTVMANIGLQRRLAQDGLDLIRVAVGDRHVVAAMRTGGYNLGGEQSGHIVLGDHATTGDGMVAALQVMAAMVRENRPAAEVCDVFEMHPQIHKNIPLNGADPLLDETVRATIADEEKRLSEHGRLVVRKSGTEPVIRIMAEAEAEESAHSAVARISEVVTAYGDGIKAASSARS